MEPVEIQKAQLRTQLRRKRRQLSDELLNTRAELLAEQLLRVIPASSVVAAFWPMPGEPDLRPFLNAHAARSGSILLPVIDPAEERLLHWARWQEQTPMIPHRSLPVLEPEHQAALPLFSAAQQLSDSDLAQASLVILLPALAISHDGVRLGQGGGYYDTTLAALSGSKQAEVQLMAVIHHSELLPAGTVPAEPHDLRVQQVVSEQGLLQL